MFTLSDTKDNEVQEPKTPCDATIQRNLTRYATRNSSPALQALIRQSEIAGYASFDAVVQPDGQKL